MPHLCELLPDICLTTEEKARRNLSQGSRRMPVGMMKTEYTEQSILVTLLLSKRRSVYFFRWTEDPAQFYNFLFPEQLERLRTSCTLFFSVALRPNAGHGLLILEVSISRTTTHYSR